MSFVNGMIANFLQGLTPEQRREFFRSAQEQVLASATAEERAQLLRGVLVALVEGLDPAERARLARELSAMLAT